MSPKATPSLNILTYAVAVKGESGGGVTLGFSNQRRSHA